jgi:hypothetical protein
MNRREWKKKCEVAEVHLDLQSHGDSQSVVSFSTRNT